MKEEIKIIQSADEASFEKTVNAFLAEGWSLKSSNCGFVNSDKYDFCNVFQAILWRMI